MPDDEARRLTPLIETVALRAGTLICEYEGPVEHVYFPTGVAVGLLAPGERDAVQVALVGSEGAFGSPLIDDLPLSPLRAVVRTSGASFRVPVRELRRQLPHSRHLRAALGRYLYVLIAQIAQVNACTCRHGVEERLARWLLTTQDRVQSDEFRLKHQTLADMLGVQRTGISLAAARLRRRGLIRYSRGVINIVDRRGLEAASCGCYAWSREAYVRAFAPQLQPAVVF
ncbi:Crp/Fnr family transcriptional regulator [Solimonas flava]|uniref:Crp/Fnr family transcriptional regulator n=1 Tax=Solimonas flava TaxID=415849 RepID=UPI000405C643|nr:Crp/Fnr family transcriptional regulator [Solimonas flava]